MDADVETLILRDTIKVKIPCECAMQNSTLDLYWNKWYLKIGRDQCYISAEQFEIYHFINITCVCKLCGNQKKQSKV